jgi:hypothetical protein
MNWTRPAGMSATAVTGAVVSNFCMMLSFYVGLRFRGPRCF